MSATPLDALDPLWFEFDPFRDIVGWNRYVPPLVDPALKTRGDIDPRHPAHSPIPPTIVFGAAPDDAWVPAHVEHPIRAACRAPSLAGPFRRLDVQRDLGPGVVATDEWRRPYPFHQTIVTTPATTRIVAQLPLDGHLYLRLADGNQTVTTAPRWVLPTAGNDGSGVLALTTRTEGAKVTPPAMASVALNVTGGQGKYAIIASSIEQDGAVVWQRLLDKRVGEASLAALRNGAKKKYNLLKVGTAHLPAHRADYAVLYGLIVESAARHGLTPAFVQAVFFREGVVLLFYPQPGGAPPAPAYRPDGVLSGFGFLGLDTVGDALNHDPAFTPPHPDIGLQQLLDEGYVHPTIVSAANLTNVRRVPPQPNEPPRPNFTADIVGWRAAIELIAAELHARLDQMLATGGHAASDLREDGRRFLSYIRYNAVLGDPTVTTDWQRIATSPPGPFIAASGDPTSWDVIKNGVVAWPASSTDPNFTGRERLRFVALTMTSVATYLDASGAFR
jgi:hypothetical protein